MAATTIIGLSTDVAVARIALASAIKEALDVRDTEETASSAGASAAAAVNLAGAVGDSSGERASAGAGLVTGTEDGLAAVGGGAGATAATGARAERVAAARAGAADNGLWGLALVARAASLHLGVSKNFNLGDSNSDLSVLNSHALLSEDKGSGDKEDGGELHAGCVGCWVKPGFTG